MCGIAGYIRTRGLLPPGVLDRMMNAVRHRGPDGTGSWTDAAAGVAFSHTRLKVQDLTEAADQPMASDDGRVVLIFNGEIYNFQSLRAELVAQGTRFRSTGDTEVLLELCRRDPSMAFLTRLNGMFAFAAWFSETRTLCLARDRTGVKPLLFAALPDGGLVFGSEMKALQPALSQLTISRWAVQQLLTLGFIAAPDSIFDQVRKLRPGHLATWRDGRLDIRRWAPGQPRAAQVNSFDEAKEAIRGVMDNAVRQRLIADVPVGVFLSGGIDSGIVTAVAARVAPERVKTFAVVFPDDPFYDERRYSRAVADMHGTDHTELPISLDAAREIIPVVQDHIGEPFADSSALPTYLLSRLTREHVTVALSGDGADELFAGYNRYAAATMMRRFGWLMRLGLYGPARRLIESLRGRREAWWGSKASMAKRAIRSMDLRRKHRHAYWMRTSDDRTYARLFEEESAGPAALERVADLLWTYRGEPKDSDDLNAHLWTEWQLSLPDDMLTKVDLMSMAHGLEVRSPFLDYRLAELVFPMPWQWKLKGFRKKHLLIETFRDMLPRELHRRPKKGFEIPVGVWIRGPLKDMAYDLIASDRCFFGRLLSRDGAKAMLEEHTTGRADHNFCLWALVSLLAWQQRHAIGIELSSGCPSAC